MSHMMRVSCAVAAAMILPGMSLPVKADLKICNRTADRVTVAAAYVNPRGGFISEGWWNIQPCGDCKTVVLSSETSDPHNYFFHAHGGGLRWEGSDRFCTSRSKFTVVGNRNCAARGFDVTGFRHVTSSSGKLTQTLTGRSSSGRVCID
jgi:uncharacterized membrane protein